MRQVSAASEPWPERPYERENMRQVSAASEPWPERPSERKA